MALKSAKCSMCGSSIDVDDSQATGVCEYCGTEFVTEKIVNVTNVTKVDKSTNIYYGETTDAKTKRDLNKAYNSLKAAGYDYVNLQASEEGIDSVLYDIAYMLAKGVTKNDPTNYDGWRCLAILKYALFMQNYEQCQRCRNEENIRNVNYSANDALQICNTAKKTALNKEEKDFIDSLISNIKIKCYDINLPSEITDKLIYDNTELLSVPKPIQVSFLFSVIFLIFASLAFIIGFINVFDRERFGFSILCILLALAIASPVIIWHIAKVLRRSRIKKVKEENERRLTTKKSNINTELSQAKTLKDYEDFVAKYNLSKL